ncbi:Protein kinase domain [Macleaya cordata]|uniref:non-specific serine/threonine protein kinase n=1 Tax=Macleaya cordata TaxID=56857 RepID=A0A200PY86_MACCD|nr:Protein kinase domain [Macleaya cordata]
MFYMTHFVCLLLVTLLGDAIIQVSSLKFSYPSFPNTNMPDLKFAEYSSIAGGALQVTPDSNNANMSNKSGRVCYKDKLKLWRRKSIASFNTTFALNIKAITEPGGEGVAFILTADSAIPDNSMGQWLGIVNASTNGSSQAQIVAVEFDTAKSYIEDVDGNHVGLDVNSINSIIQVPLSSYGVNLSSASDVIVRIQYDGKTKKMDVYVSMSNGTGFNTKNPTFSKDIDLAKHLPKDVYVGFSASTGSLIELNCVKSWSFTSTEVGSGIRLLWLWITISLVIALTIGIASYLCWRIRLEEHKKNRPDPYIIQRIGSTTSPRNFQLKELKSATRNFDSINKLGKGGFGTVYKAFLKEINMEVAIKRVSKDSHQGKKEFIAEVTTISHLEHKNLVKLIGWCYENDELLLIYKFMPNGSLDKFIYYDESHKTPEVILSWERRLNIIYGVASALDYLHDGCEKRVLHRDVKASNVMLDAEFNARLGDFGLARTVQHDGETHHSTKGIAGTPGYMAPECFHTGRASAETDVYGFGVFVMEVACGRRPGNNLQNHHYIENNIVDWVWDLYGRERIIEAVDPRLQVNSDKDQMERMLKLGLACCHPNPTERPSMRVALQVITGETAPPILPNDKPAFVWPVVDSSQEDSNVSFSGGQLSISTDFSGR